MTTPNRLTLLRVVLATAVFAALMADRPFWRAAAVVFFVAAMITDGLDGWLARRTHSESSFGKVADPIADKILVIGALIALLRTRELAIPLWTVFVIVLRELVIGGVRVIAGAQGKVLGAERWGKIKTAVQCAAVLIMLLVLVLRDAGWARPWMLAGASPLAALCALIALWSLWSYLRSSRPLLEKSWSERP